MALVLMFHYWRPFIFLGFTNSAGRRSCQSHYSYGLLVLYILKPVIGEHDAELLIKDDFGRTVLDCATLTEGMLGGVSVHVCNIISLFGRG